MGWAELEEALDALEKAITKAAEWLADNFTLKFNGIAEAAELTRRSLEARKRRRKRFAEWARGEEQRRAAGIRQYERVEIRPGGRNFSRTRRRVFKPPSKASKQGKGG